MSSLFIWGAGSQPSGPTSDPSAPVPTKTGHCQGRQGTQQSEETRQVLGPGSP